MVEYQVAKTSDKAFSARFSGRLAELIALRFDNNVAKAAAAAEIPESTVRNWLGDDPSAPTSDKLEAMADALNVTVDCLLGRAPIEDDALSSARGSALNGGLRGGIQYQHTVDYALIRHLKDLDEKQIRALFPRGLFGHEADGDGGPGLAVKDRRLG
jgi:transcriptional regulator with XRE-family HTH domain